MYKKEQGSPLIKCRDTHKGQFYLHHRVSTRNHAAIQLT